MTRCLHASAPKTTPLMEAILKGLNAAQKAAVSSRASVLQVLAPPGSGKTKTLTCRVAYLLAKDGYQPQNVICCTFTIKASREMRERLKGLVGEQLESRLLLGTFHSICRRYLVAYGYLIGIPQNFGIADSNDSLGIVKRLQKKMKFGLEPRTVRSRISHRKAQGHTIADVQKVKAKSSDAQEFALIFEEYENALATSNLLDYDDLLLRCVELLQKHPQCVANVEALLIDEFQDTNVVQFELMKLLASAKRRVTIVGDPDQSIYGFRSAEIANLERMKAYYPETATINLEENYRSASAILNLAQDVIDQDLERPAKKLKSTHCYGTLPVLRRLPNPREEASWIVSEIKRITRLTGGCIEYSDIAILLRSAFLSLLVEKDLARAGIPYKMVGGRRFFDRVEVRLVLDYLRVISHPDNNAALLSIINEPARKLGDTTISELVRVAEDDKSSLWTLLQKAAKGEAGLKRKLSKPALSGLQDFVNLIVKGRKQLDTLEPAEAPSKLIEYVTKALKLPVYLREKYKEDHEERLENVRELLTQAQDVTLESLTTEDDLPEVQGIAQTKPCGASEALARFLANVALSTEVEADDEAKKSRVTISTIHSAKGLEWPVVFVPAVYEGSIPHSRAEDTDEERRLLYVAMTRAKALLYMTFPVMQSRVESESILTQFLPNDLDHRLSKTGPQFSDKVVSDIATILSRDMPSQEDLAKGATLVGGNESQEDDLWPADGTPRGPFFEIETDAPSFMLKRGQSLSEAMSIPGFQQTSSFSTVAGFTTAGQQLNVLQQSAAKEVPTKPRLVKSSSTQGSLATFFQKGTFGEKPGKENIPPLPQSTSGPRESRLPHIPTELAGHRPGSTMFNKHALKRPQVAEDRATFSSKRHYSHFSSSPGRESTRNSTISPSNIGYTTTMTSMSQARTRNVATSFESGNIQRPAGISAPSNNFVTARRTLGVRRTMNGWDARKNK